MDNPFTLLGKTLLITGASSGIGRGVALACAGMGAKLVLTARNETGLKETLDLCEGDSHTYICADLTEEGDRTCLVNQLPIVNGLVQCAGVGSRVPCRGLSQTDIASVMRPNLEAPMLLQSELLINRRIAKGASLVYIASAAAGMPAVGNAVYSASKAAMIAYAKCLAQELAPRQIRVNCISPTMVMTALALVGASPEQLKDAERRYPLGRYGRPEDIANLVVYLLSDASQWMTGSNIEITGGSLTL